MVNGNALKALNLDFYVLFFWGGGTFLQILSRSQSLVLDFGGPSQTTHIPVLAEYSSREREIVSGTSGMKKIKGSPGGIFFFLIFNCSNSLRMMIFKWGIHSITTETNYFEIIKILNMN